MDSIIPPLKALTQNDKEMFDDFYSRCQLPFLYSSFTGLNLFNFEEDLYFQIVDGNLLLASQDKADREWRLSPYVVDSSPSKILSIKNFALANHISSIEYIPENQVELFKNYFEVVENEDWTFEVVYPAQRFKNFVGIEKNRRLNKKFQSTNSFEFREYSPSDHQAIFDVLTTWRNQTAHPDNDKSEEYGLEYLVTHPHPSTLGFVLTINGKVEGYSFGELQNNHTFGFFYVKGNHQFQGIYQALQTLTLNHSKLDNTEYFNYGNFTQLDALKNSKLMLKPTQILKNWVAKIT